MSQFSEDEIMRYSRHILLPQVGGTGQRALRESKVLVIGAGGLGSPVILYLAAAGVGTIGIADGDVVDLSNLQRQISHGTADVGRQKVISAAESVAAINPGVTIVPYPYRLNSENITKIIQDYDFIVEGTDNFPAKYLVNDACYFTGKPFSIGGILRFEGNTMTHVPGSACYRCVFPQIPPAGVIPTCAEAGVLGAVAGMIGTVQATETLKYLLGIGNLLTNRILTMDALAMQWRTIPIQKDPNCPLCGTNPEISTLVEAEQVPCSIAAEAGTNPVISTVPRQ
jgi:adenylyltransferase/sulfurtransferase